MVSLNYWIHSSKCSLKVHGNSFTLNFLKIFGIKILYDFLPISSEINSMNAHIHFSNEFPLKGRFWYTAQFSVISCGEISAYETNRKRICVFLLENIHTQTHKYKYIHVIDNKFTKIYFSKFMNLKFDCEASMSHILSLKWISRIF